MSDFNDRLLVTDTFVGLRAFDVDSLGRLQGPAFKTIFKPGENAATCGGGSPTGAMVAATQRAMNQALRTTTWFISSDVDTRVLASRMFSEPESEPAEPEHVVGGKDCGCGFYAYFNGENTYAQSDRVSALIEGYGVCTVGDKGFRASKARLVALVDPAGRRGGTWRHPAWFDRLSDHLYDRSWAGPAGVLSIAAGGLTAALGISLTLDTSAWFAPLVLLGPALLFLAFVLFKADFHGIDRHYPSIRNLSGCAVPSPRLGGARFDFELVRRNYPDIPAYPSIEAALAAHPLTPPPPPPAPSPEDADFWTRPVKR